MALYALICALVAGCLASDGTTQPQGTVMGGPVLWDGVSAYSPPGMSVVPWTGQTVYAPAAPAPTTAQIAAGLLAGGITITSTSTSALNGVYSIDATAQSNVTATETYILANGSFPTGSTMAWLDVNGTPHVFSSVTTFKAFATAIAQVVALVQLYGGGAFPSAPSMSVTIP